MICPGHTCSVEALPVSGIFPGRGTTRPVDHGCAYIYPAKGREDGEPGPPRAAVSSWVRADRAALDGALHDAVMAWLERDWPFPGIDYAPRS